MESGLFASFRSLCRERQMTSAWIGSLSCDRSISPTHSASSKTPLTNGVGVVMATDEPRYMAKKGADSTWRLRSPPVHQETGGSRCDVTASSCADAAGHFGQTHSTEPRERRATRG